MRLVILSLLGFFLLGCQTITHMTAIGGSKSDGTVRLAYEHGIFDEVRIDTNHAIQTAIEKCSAWGYTNAEAFGGSTSFCTTYNGYGNCIRARVTTEYQCIGSANK